MTDVKDIPEDVQRTAQKVLGETLGEYGRGLGHVPIARAILAEREAATAAERKRWATVINSSLGAAIRAPSS